MERRGLQISVRSMLVLVACVAVNLWCFKVSTILGIVGLNVTKHVVIAQLCLAIGVNRRRGIPSEDHPRAGPSPVSAPVASSPP